MIKPSNRQPSRGSAIRAFFLQSLAFLTLVSALWAQVIGDRYKREIATIALYSAPTFDISDSFLQRIGFTPPSSEIAWKHLPTVRKIEYAFYVAEKRRAGQGRQLLRRLWVDLSNRYEAVQAEPLFQDYFASQGVSFDPIEFDQGTRPRGPPDLPPPLPLETRRVILKLSEYCSGSASGSTYFILTRDFQLVEETAYEILRSSDSHQEALERGLSMVNTEGRESAMLRLVHRLAGVYESIRYEPTLVRYFPPDRNDVAFQGPDTGPGHNPGGSSGPDTGPPHNPGGPRPSGPDTGPGHNPSGDTLKGSAITPPLTDPPLPPERPSVSGPSLAGATQKYTQRYQEWYPSTQSRTFSNMVKTAEGFGGVIFGNSVEAEKKVPSPKSIKYEATDSAGNGQFVFFFADGSAATLKRVNKEIVRAAYEMLFEPPEGVDATAGTGFGLVGLDNAYPLTYFYVVLHPALHDTNLGWAAIMVDATPIVPDVLGEAAARRWGKNDPRGAALIGLFKQNFGSVDTYKVTDVKTLVDITVSGKDRILTVRNAEVLNFPIPASFREQCFLKMTLFRYDKNSGPGSHEEIVNEDFSEGFARSLPVLSMVSYDYYILNQFARVFSALRWAKMHGATFDKSTIPPADIGAETPARLEVSANGIKPL